MGAARKIDESVPMTTPRIMAKENERMASPPKKKMQRSTKSVVNEVMIVRVSVLLIESLNSFSVSRVGKSVRFSRIRSKTTTLSLIE